MGTQVQDSFSEKWRRIPDYGHTEATRKFQLGWYLQRYGWETMEKLAEFLQTRECILDAGTGLGRDARMYAENMNGQVYGVDISDSIDIARERLEHIPNLHLVQADIMELPFPEEMFDFIASDQVLHHTPDTEQAFKKLVPLLRRGGQIAIYVYVKKGATREYCDDFLRGFTTRMSADECYEFSRAVTEFGKALADMDVDFQRAVYWKMFKCFWNDGFDFETNVMVNFDWYHPQYAWRHTPEEVEGWFKDEGLEILHFDVGESGISVRGVKRCAE